MHVQTLLLLLALAGSQLHAQSTDQAPILQEGSLLGLDFFQVVPQADTNEVRRFLKDRYFPNLHNQYPTARVAQLRGERGQYAGHELALWVLDDTSHHAHADYQQTVTDPELQGGFYEHLEGLDEGLSSTFRVIETGKPMRQNWLRAGAIMGLHHLELRPGASPEAFERFIHQMWAPAQSDALPDSKTIFLKGIDGARKDRYSYLWIIDSEETRDFYFPSSGEVSPMYTDFAKGWSYIEDEEHLGQFVHDGALDVFTDFIVIQ